MVERRSGKELVCGGGRCGNGAGVGPRDKKCPGRIELIEEMKRLLKLGTVRVECLVEDGTGNKNARGSNGARHRLIGVLKYLDR